MVFIEAHVVLRTKDSTPHMGVENYVYFHCVFFSILLLLYSESLNVLLTIYVRNLCSSQNHLVPVNNLYSI